MTGATPRRPRKGRESCSAHRRGGQPCQAPAIPGGFVCRHHGGAAPQVRLAAERRLREERLLTAYLTWQRIHGSSHVPGRMASRAEIDALAAIATAERALEQFDADQDLIALMKMEVIDPSGPEMREALLQAARDRLAGRPWNSPVRR